MKTTAILILTLSLITTTSQLATAQYGWDSDKNWEQFQQQQKQDSYQRQQLQLQREQNEIMEQQLNEQRRRANEYPGSYESSDPYRRDRRGH